MAEWQHDLSDSAYEFQRAVWPLIAKVCGGGELISVETMSDRFGKAFDVHAGIDAFQLHMERGLRGIGSRVQWDDHRRAFPYCTFTVRNHRFNGTETEYAKRVRAIRGQGGWLYPHLTVQSFFTQPRREGELLTCAVAKTWDVVDMIGRQLCLDNCTGNASFFVVPWDEMRHQGYPIWSWSPATGGVWSNARRGVANPPPRLALSPPPPPPRPRPVSEWLPFDDEP